MALAEGKGKVMDGQASIQAQNLSVWRIKNKVLDQVNLVISAGEIVGLLGANGAGKSTLLNVLCGDNSDLRIDPAASVIINNKHLNDYDNRELARIRAVLPQSSSLNFELVVYEVIEMGLYPFPELSAQEAAKVLEQAIAWADAGELRHRQYNHLSGGERQRVQFARVLAQLMAMPKDANKPAYFLLDEPTASFDPKYQRRLLTTLQHLTQTQAVGILIILHDVNLAALYCDRLALLSQGKITAYGTAVEVLTETNLQAAYGVFGKAIPHPLYTDKLLVVWGS